MTYSHTYLTVVELHLTPHYYLTALLCTGLCFIVDLFKTSFIFNFATSPADFLRLQVGQGKRVLSERDKKQFDAIHGQIRT
jgi:hypothetical protein